MKTWKISFEYQWPGADEFGQFGNDTIYLRAPCKESAKMRFWEKRLVAERCPHKFATMIDTIEESK